MKRALANAVGLLVLALSGCAGRGHRAGGPAPEYERPIVMPWDAGKPVDPLEQASARGEAVTEPEARPDGAVADAGPAAAGDR